MEEALDILYEKYLNERLDLIFNGKREYENPHFYGASVKETKESAVKIIYTDNGKYNIVVGGKEIKLNYDKIEEFHEGYAVVKKDNKYNYIDINGKLISDTWHDYAFSFSDGWGLMKDYDRGSYSGGYFYINEKGDILNNKMYLDADSFSEGYAVVGETWGSRFYINTKGEKLKNNEYFEAESFDEGLSIIVKKIDKDYGQYDKEYNLINRKGVKILIDWIPEINFSKKRSKSKSFKYYRSGKKDFLVCVSKNITNYKIKDVVGGFRCLGTGDSFRVRHEPIMVYGLDYVVCLNNEYVYLCDRKRKKYRKIGYFEQIELDDNFIKIGDRLNLIYEGKKIDITDYYKDNLNNVDYYHIEDNVEILSKDEYYRRYESDVRDYYRSAKEKNEIIRSNKKQEEKVNDLLEKQALVENGGEHVKELAISSILKGLDILDDYEKKDGTIIRIKFDNILMKEGDHLEIKPLFLSNKFLKHIDFEIQPLKNVKLAGLDLRNTNVSFKPQEVSKNELGQNDLSNCNLEGVQFPVSTSFVNVNICGSKFTTDDDPTTFDINEESLSEGIYDDNTTLNGVPLVLLIKENDNEKRVM